MRSIFVLLILVMIGLNGKGQSVTALPDSVLSQCCLEVTLLNGNVTTVDWVFIQYVTRDGSGTKLFVEYAPNFGGIQWETQIRIQDDFDEVIERSKFIILPFTVGSTDYGIHRNWIANIEENTTTGGTWIYGRFGTPTKRKFSAVEDYPTLKALLLACRPRAIVVAENGLYTEGDTVRMGGVLIEDTRIQTDTFDFEMIDTLTSTAFGIDHNGVYGDTTFYAARRWGSWRNLMTIGRGGFFHEIRDTVGGEKSTIYQGIDAFNAPYFDVITSNGSSSKIAWLSQYKDNAFWLMKDTDTNPNYTASFFMGPGNVGIGMSEIGGGGEPGNGVSVIAYGSGTADEYIAITTKGVDNSTATVGQFLQLQDVLTGEVEFATVDLSSYISGSGTTNYIPRFTGAQSIGNSNLTDNNTVVSILNNKPFSLGQWTTAGRPSGVNGYTGYNTSFNWLDIYSSSGWFSPARAATTGGAFTSGYIPFGGTGGLTESPNLYYSSSVKDLYSLSGGSSSGVRILVGENTTGRTVYFGYWPSAGATYRGLVANTAYFGAGVGATQLAINTNAAIPIVFYTDDWQEKMRLTAAGRLGIGTNSPQRLFHVAGEVRISDLITDAPTQILGADADGDLGAMTVSGGLSITSGVLSSTWLKPQLESGSATINAAANADLFINNLDSVKFGKTLIRSSNNGLLILNPDVGASGISAFGAGYHTVINGNVSGSDGGTGHIVIGGTATANTTGSIFNVSIGYTSNTQGAYASAFGYNADATADNTLAIGRNAVANENGEISIGSVNYVKMNLDADTTRAIGLMGVDGTPNHPAIIGIATYDADKILGLAILGDGFSYDGDTLTASGSADGNGIYTGSGTLSSTKTRALISPNNKLSFSQVYNAGADSARITITNSNVDGHRAVEIEVLDTVHAGGKAKLTLSKDSDNDIMSLRGDIEDQDGATTFTATGSGFSVTATGAIGLLADVESEVQITGLVKAKQEAYNEITSTSSPQTLSSTYSDNLINQGGTQATFTLNMPASPEDGQVCTITYNNAISTLTIDGNGETIVGSAVVTAVPGSQRKFKFYQGIGWIKIY